MEINNEKFKKLVLETILEYTRDKKNTDLNFPSPRQIDLIIDQLFNNDHLPTSRNYHRESTPRSKDILLKVLVDIIMKVLKKLERPQLLPSDTLHFTLDSQLRSLKSLKDPVDLTAKNRSNEAFTNCFNNISSSSHIKLVDPYIFADLKPNKTTTSKMTLIELEKKHTANIMTFINKIDNFSSIKSITIYYNSNLKNQSIIDMVTKKLVTKKIPLHLNPLAKENLHDRFIIFDSLNVYCMGASINFPFTNAVYQTYIQQITNQNSSQEIFNFFNKLGNKKDLSKNRK